ncbi:MAG: CoA-substrate-specific enzyme activase [Deltaproteobacteria bacterium]|nr:CoA-substrate-specific enzyme activase [Deltaproteobacteria bacterium]
MRKGKKTEMILGLDFGAEICKAVLLDESLQVVKRWETLSRGNPAGALQTIAATLFENCEGIQLKVGVTGSGREAFDFGDNVQILNELIALALGVVHLYPAVRSVIEIGAESSRWLLLDPIASANGQPELLDFGMNERCAAGSGAFLRQQASRLKLTISGFSALAASAPKGASIAGRCSVFAKSDMIHHQQKGTPIAEIAYGVCLALARNYAATISRGKECFPPICMTGGGALNEGLLRAFRDILGLQENEWILSEWPLYTCALGAALNAAQSGSAILFENREDLLRFLKAKKSFPKSKYLSLGALENLIATEPSCAEGETARGFLGVDVGSVSTNLALVDGRGRVLAGVYVPTSGRPIEAVREGYGILKSRCGGKLEISGIGTTGSGRHLAGRLLRADVIHNEITCQMQSTVHYFPETDTIFEIGGQDSKYISVKDGKLLDFTMNKICAAGTGSFLEEQAGPLGIQIEGEFSALAAQANASVVRAFSLLLGRTVRVHPFNRISGAIGAALIAKERAHPESGGSPIHQELEERIQQEYSVSSFECPQCSNRCQVNKILLGREALFFGDTCERYTSGQTRLPSRTKEQFPDLFKEREDLLKSLIRNPPSPALKIGLPRASFMFDYLPFWLTFFNGLGCAVTLSPESSGDVLEKGLQQLPAETCFPIKLAFGHVKSLMETEVDGIFFPSLIDLHQNPDEPSYLCPYGEHVPFMARSVLQKPLLAPSVLFNSGADDFVKSLGPLKRILGQDDDSLKTAYLEAWQAQKDFRRKLRARGEEVLGQFRSKGIPLWAVLGKPYTVHDPFLNLNLTKHLQKMEVLALPIDFIPSQGDALRDWESRPVWRYNQEIIRATLWCAGNPSILPLLLSNFGCGPDGVTTKHLEKILKRTPRLLLEFDEHRAEAGLITRLEAFLDEVTSTPQAPPEPIFFIAQKKEEARPIEEFRERPFVLPYFSDHVYAFAGALRGVGLSARILPPPDDETLALGEEWSSGKECHAFSLFAGDLAKLARSPRRDGEVFFFPGARCICLVTQFEEVLNYLLQDMGSPWRLFPGYWESAA